MNTFDLEQWELNFPHDTKCAMECAIMQSNTCICSRSSTIEYAKKLIEPEICICAAVLDSNGEIFRGHRHGYCFSTIRSEGKKISDREDAQGFITSRNRYVSREEGRKLQNAAGIPSASPEGYIGNTLFSEDLY